MSRTIRLTKILEYYDGPILFEGRDFCGGHYIGVAVGSEGSDDLYAIIGVEPDRLRRFRNGSLDLLALMTEREDATWFTARRVKTARTSSRSLSRQILSQKRTICPRQASSCTTCPLKAKSSWQPGSTTTL